ncbi:nitroreductase family protein [candidate division KSB1 bacterium]|nr:nitroreductase family protein [candidate division KSB1 bacterium]
MPGSGYQSLQDRKTSRAFSAQKLSDETIFTLMQGTQLTASCYNHQSWRFLFLTEQDALEKAHQALSGGNGWAKRAPLLVIGFSRHDFDCEFADSRKYYLFDLGMATQTLLLVATELDLIARPMAGFSPEGLREAFDIAPEFEIYIVIAVGYQGNLEDLEKRWQIKSKASRTRNPLPNNFFLNKIETINK